MAGFAIGVDLRCWGGWAERLVWQAFVCRSWGAAVVANGDRAFGELTIGPSIMDWGCRGAAAKAEGTWLRGDYESGDGVGGVSGIAAAMV
ncbi:MAG: hypothetical protein WB723_12195 [Candidatus Acidiferrales bacterium]